MSQNRNSISKQVLAWAAVFALALSTLPYSVADQTSDEYFESWSYELSDTDGDDQYDTISFTFDPNTNISDYVEVEVNMSVRDSNGNIVGGDSEDYEIYWTEEDSFEMEWFVDDCDDWDSDCEGPFNFEFYLYEDVNGFSYFEDNFTESNISLHETTIAPEGIIQVDHGVFPDDLDGINNDLGFYAHMEDYEVENVTIELERKVGLQWVDVGDEETDGDGNAFFKNMTAGEYRWSSTYDGESIDALSYTFVFAGPNSEDGIGHVGIVGDVDEDGHHNDFGFYRILGNGSGGNWYSNDGVYVELYYAENNTLYDEGGGNGSDELVIFNDVLEGNYTFNMYNASSDGDLLQSGWMHSYGSLNTDYEEYFESWSSHTEDSNGDGVANNVFVKYNPDTECNCSVDINVRYNVYDSGTGMYIDSGSQYHEITSTEFDNFETDVFYPPRDANYTFYFSLYDTSGNSWTYEDNFSFTIYLECDSQSNYSNCDSNEYFESWSKNTEDTNGDGVANNIFVNYNPDTDCNCSIGIRLNYYVHSDETNDHEYGYHSHNITGTEIDNFETDIFYPSGDGNYTFRFNLYDDDFTYEDNFTFTVYLECDINDNNSDCDTDEWFEDWGHVTEDEDGDNLDDTIVVDFDPNTECNCEKDIRINMYVYKNSSGSYAGYEYDEFIINGTQVDSFEMEWTNSNSSASYDFDIRLYDSRWNLEDSFWIYDVYLHETSGAGGSGDEDEYFDWFYYYTNDIDEDGHNDTIEFEYDPDTTCDCYINITTYFDFYDNQTGNFVDSFDVDDEIYSDDNDYFYDEWSPSYNGTFDVIVRLYDDEYLEDEERFDNVQLNVRSANNTSEDYYFSEWDYDASESEGVMTIVYDPDTTCNCYKDVSVEIEIYDSQNNQYVDFIEHSYEIFRDDYDWFDQSWSAPYNGSFDFYVFLVYEGYIEDSFLIESIYLNEYQDDGSHSNNGIAHLAYISSLDDVDEYVNDFIGIVYSESEVYFEISYEGNVVESGYSDDGVWVAGNLTEGWYFYQIIENHDEDHMLFFQSGSFYSYGNNSHNSSDIINVGIGVAQDENQEGFLEPECDAGPCDDIAIIAYIGDPDDGGVENIDFDILQWNDEEEQWNYYVTLVTNESGMVVHHDIPCGEYMWTAELNGNEASARFDIHANCNVNYRAWFDYIEYYFYDEDDDNLDDTIYVDYSINAECSNCEYMDLLLILDVYNQDYEMVFTFEEYFSVGPSNSDFISFAWQNNISGENFTFHSILEHLVDDGQVTVQDGAEDTFFLAIFNDEPDFTIEDVTGRDMAFEGQNIEFEVVLQGSNDVQINWYMGDGTIYEDTHRVFHTYQDSGNYEIIVHAHDGSISVEESFQIYVINVDPIILNIMMDENVDEGDQVSFNVQFEDVPMDMDDISVRWVFPDEILEGNFVQYTFEDDGEFLISVEINDGDGGSTTEQRMVTVQNVAPIFIEFALPSGGEQGIALDFRVSATDPGDDIITYKFDFGDGTAQLLTQNGNVTHKFASGDTFEIVICAMDEDGGETCRTEVVPVAVLEQIEDSGLPGFGLIGVISALGVVTILRRRTR